MTEQLLFTSETRNPEETEQAGARFAAYLLEHEPNGAFTAMYGDLGAGKTAFVRGAAESIAPGAHVQSPTYNIVNEYFGQRGLLLHFDMYRIDDEDSLDSVGYWDYLTRGGYCFVEWSEKIPYALPASFYKLEIRRDNTEQNENRRVITVSRIIAE